MKETQPNGKFLDLVSRIPGDTWQKCRDVGLKNARLHDLAGAASILDDGVRAKVANPDYALILGAGPSLHRNRTVQTIKENGFDGFIVSCDSALYLCLRSGVVPHYVVTVDPDTTRIVRWFGDPDIQGKIGKDDYYKRQDYDPAFRDESLEQNQLVMDTVNRHGPSISAIVSTSASTSVVRRLREAGMKLFWWNPMVDDYDRPDSVTRELHDLNGLPCMNAGGNVGSASWAFAHSVLGAKNVALTGMDFAYYPDTPKTATQYFHSLKNLVGQSELDEGYTRVQNPENGSEWFTDPVYYWYREAFLELVKEAECRTYNCTGGGILFGPGITTMDLEQYIGLARAEGAVLAR